MTLRRKCNDTPNEEMISWSFGGIEGYQFAGTGPVRYQDFESIYTPGRYFPRMYYTWVQPLLSNGRPVNKKSGEGKRYLVSGEELVLDDPIPMISNFSDGTNSKGVSWSYVPDLQNIHNYLGNPDYKLNAWLVNQPDGNDVHYWYGIKANPFLIDTWSQGPQTLYFKQQSFYGGYKDRIAALYDNGFDIPPGKVDVTDKDKIRVSSYRPVNSSWYRRSCLVDLEAYVPVDEIMTTIKRSFVICYDVNHVFYAFPTNARNKDLPKEVSQKEGQIQTDYIKTKTVPWPSSVDIAKIGPDIETQYRPDWSFRHDGKAAVCIARIIDEPWSENGITSTWYKGDGNTESPVIGVDYVPVKETLPILVEINLLLQITGNNLEDFTFDIILGRVIDPIVTGRSIVSADYSVRDFSEFNIKADDLIILEYEMRMTEMMVPIQSHNVGYHYNYTVPGFPEINYRLFPDNLHIDFDLGNLYVETSNADFTLEQNIQMSSGNYLVKPNLATVAKVKNLGKTNIDSGYIIRWLAHYSSSYITKYQMAGFYYGIYTGWTVGTTKVVSDQNYLLNCVLKSDYDSLLLNDITGIHLEDWFNFDETNDVDIDVRKGEIFYKTIIQSIELSTLTFLLSATMTQQGLQYSRPITSSLSPLGNKKKKDESISGVLQVLISFGVEESREFSGFNLLQSTIEDMFDMNINCPVNSYKYFDLRANLTSTESIINGIELNGVGIVFPETYYHYSKFAPFRDLNSDLGNTIDSNLLNTVDFLIPSSAIIPGYFDTFNDEAFLKADVQDFIIDYGLEVTVKNRVFNCCNLIHNWKYINNTPRYIFKVIETGGWSIVTTPNVFTFFDSDFIDRPGRVHYKSWFDDTANLGVIEGTPNYSNYPFGKIYFNRVYGMTFDGLNVIQNRVKTHPNGSFAVCSLPIIAFTEKHSMNYTQVVGGVNFTSGSGNADTQQLILDKIKYVYEVYNKISDTIDRFETTTTHLEMFEKAFEMGYTLQDYQFSLIQNGQSVGVPGLLGWHSYSGGLKLAKKWSNPKLGSQSSYSLYSGSQDYSSSFYDVSRVISPGFAVEGAVPMVTRFTGVDDFQKLNIIGNSSSYFLDNTNISLDLMCPTPRMESIFLVSNPYIDRDENK